MIIKKQDHEIQVKTQALCDMIAGDVCKNGGLVDGKKRSLKCTKTRKENDPMWVKVVVAVEENVTPMLMLLPKN